MANNAWAQKRSEGGGDAPEGPGLKSMGAEYRAPNPPPYPTASSGLIIQHLLPGDEVGIASRVARSGEPLHILRHGCRAGVDYPPGKQHGAEATSIGRLVGPD